MFVSPGEVAFLIGSVPIYYYGIIMAISLLTGVFISVLVTRSFYPNLSPDVIYDISPHIILGAIIFARLYYCILNYHYYAMHPIEIIEIRQGGISIHGAIFGGFIFGAIYALRHKLPLLKLCENFSYGLVLGQAIGRWGNFFNSEAFGLPTDNFLKLYIPIYKRPLEYMQYNYFHPTFLYESIADVLIFLILFFTVRRIAKGKDGIVFFSYLILYSLVRIIVEQIRIDSVLNLWGIPVAQWVSVFIIILSIGFLMKVLKKKPN